jgi:prepilin-type N-terminal cleavage/methylation domain-containing protein
MRNGFTLMEVLAVILVIAVVASMATPAFRSVRHEMKQAQAKTATQKVAEAVKTYYQVSRGQLLQVCFSPTTATGKALMASTSCTNPGATGIPHSATALQYVPATATNNADDTEAGRLFACGYLSYKDFASLPYTFCTYEPTGLPAAEGRVVTDRIYALAFANSESAGHKYYSVHNTPTGYIYVDGSMDAKDTY